MLGGPGKVTQLLPSVIRARTRAKRRRCRDALNSDLLVRSTRNLVVSSGVKVIGLVIPCAGLCSRDAM